MKVLKRRGEALEAALLKKCAQADLDACSVAQRIVPRAALAEFLRNGIARLVLGAERVDGPVVDRRIGDLRDEVAHPIAVDGKSETHLGGHLVALGHRHLAHVVSESREFRPLQIVPSPRRAHPGGQPVLDLGVLPVPDDDLPAEAHARVEEPGLAIAVRGLVEVHEVHVDLPPWEVAIELGVEMDERLPEHREAANPHLRRREGVHPEDEPCAIRIAVCFEAEAANLVGRRQERLERNVQRDAVRGVQGLCDRSGVGGDLLERAGAVKMLAAGDEPDYRRFGFHGKEAVGLGN